jgi:NAD-dependent SIR2 family protein deacetylase
MDELMNDLKISQKLKEERHLQNYIAEMIENSDRYMEILRKFYNRCENAEPTIAHLELARIVQHYQHTLITENVDQLHQKTKLSPLNDRARKP